MRLSRCPGVPGLPFIISLACLLAMGFARPAGAQVQGQVESIGFDNYFRPDCWTPLVVDLRPETQQSAEFQLQVKQEDLDRDYPIYSKVISVTGVAENASARQQKFRVYFRPQPTDGGLPDTSDGTQDIRDLRAALQVSIHDRSGKWISDLPITSTIQNLDPKAGMNTERRGTKFVLAVTDGRNAPPWLEYKDSIGILENVEMLRVRPEQLPENVLGYDAVDAVLWLNADPAELKSGTDERFRALETFVHRGGKLIISTPLDWQKLLTFGELLPVNIESMQVRLDPEPLRSIVKRNPNRPRQFTEAVTGARRDPWDAVKGPFNIARATIKPGAIIEEFVDWSPDPTASRRPASQRDRTPWLVRRPFGAGGVTWVAQDLGAAILVDQARTEWPTIWDRVFDWRNDTRVVTNQTTEEQKEDYSPASAVDLGASLLSGLELQSKSAWLITLAIVFFIGYWLVAGPGVFAWLVARRQTSASWFAFAATAIVATLLTVLLVRLTLRGDAELRHISLVRQAGDNAANVKSRFGLYIPRDGVQRIELKDMAAGSTAAISAFGIHPQYLSKAPDDPGPEYQVFVREPASREPAVLRVPFRSTLKKFDADWTGKAGGRIEGSAKLVEKGYIEGTLTNGTGRRLRNVYIAFRYRNPGAAVTDDWILYLPSWDAGVSLDLNREFNTDKEGNPIGLFTPERDSPDQGKKIRGTIGYYWSQYWAGKLRKPAFSEDRHDDFGQTVRTSIPVLSFFDRLSPRKNTRGQQKDRFELLRRSARSYDVSAALSAGALVIVAESEGPVPLPIPLEVEGDALEGSGSVVYQFVLPLDNGYLNASADEDQSS